MPVGEICSRTVTVVEPTESALVAAKLMRDEHVGNVIVVDRSNGGNRPVGILTDRDIVLELVAKEVNLSEVTVGDAMSDNVFTLPEDQHLLQALDELRSRGVRRAPVVGADGNLVGIVSVDDFLAIMAEQMKDLASLVSKGQRRERLRRTG